MDRRSHACSFHFGQAKHFADRRRAHRESGNDSRESRANPASHTAPKQVQLVHKKSDQEWIIKAYDLDSRKTTELIKTFPGVEDYAWTPSGDLLMAKDAKVFVRKKSDWAWQEVADFSPAGLKTITRIAVSPNGDKIAFVAR